MWCHSSTPTATGASEASLEAQEVIDDEDSGQHVVAIPTAGRLMRGPEQAYGIIKERIWCGEPPTVQMGVKGGQSPHRAEGGGGHWASAGGAGVGHRTGGCARARAPETRLSLTGAEEVEKKSEGCHKGIMHKKGIRLKWSFQPTTKGGQRSRNVNGPVCQCAASSGVLKCWHVLVNTLDEYWNTHIRR